MQNECSDIPRRGDSLCTNIKGCPEGRSLFDSGSSNRGEQHPCWHTIFRLESLVCYTFVKLWLSGKEPTALHLPVTPGILRWKVSRKGDS